MEPIRAITPADDLLQLTELLHRAYARLGAMGLNYTAVDQDVATTRQRLAGGHGLVAVDGRGQYLGTVVVHAQHPESACEYFGRPGVAALHQFAVEPAAQGGGLGLALVQACEAWARSQGCHELALDTAEPATHLRRLYARWGFVDVGHVQWPGKVYRSVVMSKPLQNPKDKT